MKSVGVELNRQVSIQEVFELRALIIKLQDENASLKGKVRDLQNEVNGLEPMFHNRQTHNTMEFM